MSSLTSLPRKPVRATITAAALMAPLLVTVQAQAAPCNSVKDPSSGKLICNPVHVGDRPPVGGGPGGGGSGGGDPAAPPPEGLNPDQGTGFVPVPGGPAEPAPLTTAQLVQMAMTTAAFPVPKVHTAPTGKTYVRVRTSLWVEGFRIVETDPVSAGAQTVQARAEPVSVEWNMGEDKIECDNAGSRNGKACGYTYRRSSAGQSGGGSYKITATISWKVTWQCEGADCTATEGALPPMTMTSAPTPLIVSEIQTNTDQ